MDSTVLITGARAPVALDLARKFAASGARVLVAESSAADLCRASTAVARGFRVPPPNRAPRAYLDELVAIVKREGVDLLVPTCEEIFWVARGLDRLCEHCAVLAEPLPVLRSLHSKMEFIERARALGLPVPRTTRDVSALTPPFVLKPEFSRFATKVRVVRDRRPAVEGSWVAQELLEGPQICTYSVAVNGRLAAHAAYAVDFTASRACISFAPVADPDVDAWVAAFVAGTGFTGQIAFDFIGALPLECNPRATSGAHLFGDELAGVLAGAAGRTVPAGVLRPDPGKRSMIGLAMVLFGLASVRSPRRLGTWWRTVRSSDDVIAVPGDRGPFAAQFAVVWRNWIRSLWTGRSLVECSTYDIEWDGR